MYIYLLVVNCYTNVMSLKTDISSYNSSSCNSLPIKKRSFCRKYKMRVRESYSNWLRGFVCLVKRISESHYDLENDFITTIKNSKLMSHTDSFILIVSLKLNVTFLYAPFFIMQWNNTNFHTKLRNCSDISNCYSQLQVIS